MTTIANSNFLKYSRYFPNHLEYASQVPRDSPHPIATTSASQTDGSDTIQTYTQTDDKIVHEIAIQTEDEEVTKSVVEEPQPKFELMKPQQSSTGDGRDGQTSTIPPPEEIWDELTNFGEPRIVVSVIGAYNECTPTYEWADHSFLRNAISHVAKYSGRCGFLFHEKNADFIKSVVSRSCFIEGLPQKYGYSSMHFSNLTLPKYFFLQNDDQHTGDTSEYFKDLLELEKYINSEGQVSFKEGEKKSKMLSNIRVPVALLVLNGDLDTLDHVMRAIYSDISVVVVKGTGGAADLIALCLEDFSKLKRELPIMITRRFTKGNFNKILEVFKMIIEKDWMISIFDIKVEEHDSLWERITDGIIRAWSFEEKHDEEIMMPEYLSLNGGEYISNYVANIDGLTRRELFAGYSLNESDGQENIMDENRQNVFVTSFHVGKIDIMEQILNSNETFSMSKSTFQGLWKQEIAIEDDKILQSVCPSDIEDPNAPIYIADELLKGLCCSKIGMITCCKRCRKSSKGDNNDSVSDTVPTNETLRIAVLLNQTKNAATLWYQFENPMMTALISSMYLTSLAKIAEEKFEENRQDAYQSHAKLFLSRAVRLLEKMFTDDEQMAIEALDNVCDVWGHIESPLHFGHQFNIEEFISHSSNQKDASKRLFSYNVAAVEDVHLDIKPEKITAKAPSSQKQKSTSTTSVYPITISGWFSFIKDHWSKNSKLAIFTAPATKIVIHLLVDLMQYLVILIILVFAAGVVYHANVYPSHTVTGSSNIEYWTILQIPYWQVYGELFLDTLQGNDNSGCKDNDPNCAAGDWITPVIAAFYMMLTNWLLLNIVIAMFSARFKEIRNNSGQKWRYYRHSVIINFEDRIPSPLNFPFRIFSFLWYTTKCPCCPCYKKTTKGDMSNMLNKQRQFAKEIIAEEKHERRILRKQRTKEKHPKKT
ncbi:unnamed protein product [Mytilus coruscus]|uniref:Uncharacterized protein n=1 Tax=Mytilus coruscus TaxID=42192 RepID=A0A6J8B1D9_MYTCO|nr:unnamed protein product [Mytilus coruscus]